MNKPQGPLLAIDTVLGSGSVSLWVDDEEIDFRLGEDLPPLSESLLSIVRNICDENRIEVNNIGCLAISVGPGSYTSIRVGISTALGLALGVGCETIGISALKAMAYSCSGDRCRALLTAGGNEFVAQDFERNDEFLEAVNTPELINIDQLASGSGTELIVDQKTSSLLEKLKGTRSIQEEILVASDNGAGLVGIVAINSKSDNQNRDLTPIYAREFDVR